MFHVIFSNIGVQRQFVFDLENCGLRRNVGYASWMFARRLSGFFKVQKIAYIHHCLLASPISFDILLCSPLRGTV